MPNIRLDIEYDGEPFHGWQRQRGVPTIQEWLEKTIAQVVGRKVVVYGAGRTDSGVHARAQVANFYLEEDISIPNDRWGLMLNTKLPHTIRVLRSLEVDAKFHAQRSALSKRYEYRILNRKYASALDRRVYFLPHPIDWEGMKVAAKYFVGTHDFRALQSGKNTLRSTVRTITGLDIVEDAFSNGLYVLSIEGTGFLRQMVRNIVGTLLDVGEGRKKPEWVKEVLLSGRREFAGRSVPARGLCLVSVRYGHA